MASLSASEIKAREIQLAINLHPKPFQSLTPVLKKLASELQNLENKNKKYANRRNLLSRSRPSNNNKQQNN